MGAWRIGPAGLPRIPNRFRDGLHSLGWRNLLAGGFELRSVESSEIACEQAPTDFVSFRKHTGTCGVLLTRDVLNR